MATLSGQSIDTTYPGLIKTTDNAAITGTLKALEDGSGNTLPIEVSSTTVNFTGTVTGIPAAGLVAGSGANSMESSGDLTDLDADASGTAAIALGRNSLASNEGAIGIGNYGRASNAKAIAIGQETTATGNSSIAMGWNSTASATGAVALGSGVTASTDNTVSVKALQTQTASTPTAGGIIMTDAGSTQRRINITSGGTLQVDGNAVGVAASVSTTTKATLSGPSSSDTIVQTFTIPGGTFAAGDILEFWAMNTFDFTGGGFIYDNWQISNSASFNSGTYYGLGGAASSSAAGFAINKHFIIHSTTDATGTAPDSSFDQNGFDGLITYPDVMNMTIDWSQPVYIHNFGFVDNAGSSLEFTGGYIKKKN